jgi:TusA-related sulfurtransferase
MTAAAIAVDGGDLPLGGGLLALVRPALTLLAPDGVLAILSRSGAASADLASWCRAESHEYLGAEDAGNGTTRHLVKRGRFGVQRAEASDELPERADAMTGFAPHGSVVEAGGPRYPFDLLERDRVAPPEVAELYEQAVAAQWSATRDIPWSTIPRHEPALELAVRQVMTFLAENELSALYVPSRFIARLHPAYVGVAMFLATQMQDESRHIDVFLRRAHATGSPPAISSATTSRSLHSLLEVNDFAEASFLLSVLGEGTFLDLLAFVERFAPDEATAELAKRARIDEARHVHFGMAHVRHALLTTRRSTRDWKRQYVAAPRPWPEPAASPRRYRMRSRSTPRARATRSASPAATTRSASCSSRCMKDAFAAFAARGSPTRRQQ